MTRRPIRPRYALLLGLALAAARPAAAGAECPDGAIWPGEAFPSRADAVATERPDAVADLDAYAFTRVGEEADRRGIRTEAVLVVHAGHVVYERYAEGWDAGKRHLAWSMTKSVTNALTGIAVARGLLTVDDSICDHLDAVPETHCAITVGHLLEFSSGLDWQETYEGGNNQASSVLAMLYGEGRGDMVRFILGHALRDAPGTTFAYSSGDTNVLAAVLGRVFEGEGPRFPWTALFEPLGMDRPIFERDGAGTLVGSSYLYLTTPDLARFGTLFLNDGCWSGERLLPAGWVAASTEVSDVYRTANLDGPGGAAQGRQWWLNRPVDGDAPWEGVPEDAFAGLGHWGQSLVVIPSMDLVVVRFADDREAAFDRATFLTKVMALLEAP
jgi:CubicO group peptidase (beta-lactamase class C family)